MTFFLIFWICFIVPMIPLQASPTVIVTKTNQIKAENLSCIFSYSLLAYQRPSCEKMSTFFFISQTHFIHALIGSGSDQAASWLAANFISFFWKMQLGSFLQPCSISMFISLWVVFERSHHVEIWPSKQVKSFVKIQSGWSCLSPEESHFLTNTNLFYFASLVKTNFLGFNEFQSTST